MSHELFSKPAALTCLLTGDRLHLKLEAMALTVKLSGPSPWGFRITGGRDFNLPVTVTKVSDKSKAAAADLRPGDVIVSINGDSTEDMLYVEAQNKIKKSSSGLQLSVDRPDLSRVTMIDGPASPNFLATRFQDALKIVKDENSNSTEDLHSSPGSLSPRSGSPFSPPSPLPGYLRNGYNDRQKSALASEAAEVVISRRSLPTQATPPSVSVYRGERRSYSRGSNSPVNTPSPQNRPASPLHPGAPPSHTRPEIVRSSSPPKSADLDPRMNRFEEDSEVYKMIQENQETRAPPRQSNAFLQIQAALDTEAEPYLPSRLSPNAQVPVRSSVAGAQNLRTCGKCGTSIVNQAVRIQEDEYRHPACYVCSDCGLNLKMRGHFWYGDLMYCEKHAREHHQAAAAKLSPGLHS